MKPRRHRGLATGIIAILILIAGITGAVLFMNLSDSANADRADADMFIVTRGDFDISIPASGELAAAKQTEIENQLETNAIITEIVEEGTFVRKGDVLFRLNDQEIRDRIVDAADAIDQAQNALENAVANLEIAKKSRESQLSEANLRIRLAERALDAWMNGDDVSRKMQLDLAIVTAEKNYKRAKERYDSSVDLFADKYISKDELQGDEISLLEADARLQQAKLDQQVYMEYNRLQEKEKLESEVNQANDEKLRIDQRTRAEVSSTESDVESRERQLERDNERLARLEEQLEYCVVLAPTDGLVVYDSSLARDRRRDEQPPDVGTQLSRNEDVMVLPDTTNMVAEVKVNEALSGQIEAGQWATIVSDAFPGKVFNGRVLSVGVLAQGGGWRDPNRRDYTVRIDIDNETGAGLKPSMRCKANILIDQVDDVVYVPVPAVFRNGPVTFVYVPDGNGFAQQEVEIGRSSELYVEVTSGLEAGERVLLREPGPDEINKSIPVQETRPIEQLGDRRGPTSANAEGGNESSESQSASRERRTGSQSRSPMSEADRTKMRKEMLKRYDTDGDGKLSDTERAEMMKQVQNSSSGAPG